jgi:hypothetical protein
MMIRDNKQFVVALKRMHELPGSTMTYNSDDGKLSFVVRDLPQGRTGKSMTFDLGILVLEDDHVLNKVLSLENDGWFDEQEDDSSARIYVLEQFELDKPEPDKDDIDAFVNSVNQTVKYKICPCDKYLIKDGDLKCFYCEMTATDEDLALQECPICSDEGLAMHMKKTSCCGKDVHRSCAIKWALEQLKKSEKTSCALCRTEIEEPEAKRIRTEQDSQVQGLTAQLTLAIREAASALLGNANVQDMSIEIQGE